jgi:hypothetical protein
LRQRGLLRRGMHKSYIKRGAIDGRGGRTIAVPESRKGRKSKTRSNIAPRNTTVTYSNLP